MKISIIVAVYNSALYLEDCINSILEQTYTDFELLLIDDGSSDHSWDICKKYESRDQRIIAVHQENQGVSAVRNLGLSMCRGEYVRFFDADDTMPKDALDQLIKPMLANAEVDLVIGRFDTNDGFIFQGDEMEGLKSPKETATHYLKYARTFYYGVTWNKLYRLDIIRDNHIQFQLGLHWSEDLFFNLLYFEKCKKIYYIKNSVCFYYRRENTLSDTGKTYDESNMVSIEMVRFQAIYQYILSVNPDKVLEMKTYDFVFVTINQSLNFILDNTQYSFSEKYKRFIEVAVKEDVHKVINQYHHRNAYLLTRIMICLIKKEKYKTLFAIYYMKHLLKKSKKVTDYFSKNKQVLPKFPL